MVMGELNAVKRRLLRREERRRRKMRWRRGSGHNNGDGGEHADEAAASEAAVLIPPDVLSSALCAIVSDLLRVVKVGGAVWSGHMSDKEVISAAMACRVGEGCNANRGAEEKERVGGGRRAETPVVEGGGEGEEGSKRARDGGEGVATSSSSLPIPYRIEMTVIQESYFYGSMRFQTPKALRADKPVGIVWRKLPI